MKTDERFKKAYDHLNEAINNFGLTIDDFRKAVEEIEYQNKKPEKIDFGKLLVYLNKATGREFRVVSKTVRASYRARIRDGYTKKVILTAIDQAVQVKAHKENGFQYLTIEFFSRASTLDKYGYASNKAKYKEQVSTPVNSIPIK